MLEKQSLKSSDEIQEKSNKSTISIGIIGCGRLGNQIAQSLLTYGQIEASHLQISTRRPETLGHLQQKGVSCFFNNKKLVSSVDLVFFCVLPSQMPCVAYEVKDSISPTLLTVCPFSSLSPRKLRQMLGTSNIIRPQLVFPEQNPNPNYNLEVEVAQAFKNKQTVMGTCPLSVPQEGLTVHSDARLVGTIILAVSNMCKHNGLTTSQTVAIISRAVFGESKKKPLAFDRLTVKDFGVAKTTNGSDKYFPLYDLADSHETETTLFKTLQGNKSMQEGFATRYWHVFDDYICKQTFGYLT
ncbi:unnamed protein product [Lymnaea stagnalis]|uniref:Pyrroline-5-carboxylate reductase catalytic N-terminal domain-containing protein n=1 Tax=Lymnaea stagnalis TaxID=6523 RepID=A0AAV2HUK9_LYMST